MNILVTGATGFIGNHLVEQLVIEKHRVFALVRKTSKLDKLKALGVNLIYADITDEKSLESVYNHKIETLYHCAALVKDNDRKKLFRVNVTGTENICRLCMRVGVERLVYLSSVAVVSGNNQLPLTEDLPYCATNLYGISKVEAEKKVLDYRQKGLKVVVLRPAMVYGEGEPHAFWKLIFALKHRLLPLLEEGRCRWHLAYLKNVVSAMTLALHKEEFLRDTFFVADEEVLTVKDIFVTLSKAVNAPLPHTLPSCLTPVFKRLPYIGKRLGIFLKDRVYDITRIKSIGYIPKFHTKEALACSAVYAMKYM